MKDKLKQTIAIIAFVFTTAFAPMQSVPEYRPGAKPSVVAEAIKPKYTEEDLYYLSRTMWAEARGEGQLGMLHVGSVILNRVKDPRFPNSIKAVVLQPKQFTVWSKGNPNYRGIQNAKEEDLRLATSLAKRLLIDGSINRFLYFESTRLGKRGTIIGKHSFR